jgi:hypothetical protein
MNRSREMGRVVKAAVVGALALGVATVTATTAEAQGDRLNFTGSANLYDAPGSSGTQLFVDFLVNGSVGNTPTGTVSAIETINGTFDPEITVGTPGVIQDLTISTTGVVGAPISPFLTMGGYTFTLNSSPMGNTFGPISLMATPTGTIGFFGVVGTVTGGDFGANLANYTGTFTTQFTGQTPEQVFAAVNSGGTLPVSFSAEFVVGTVIPEPSTYVLMATGLGLLAFVGRRRRSSTLA